MPSYPRNCRRCGVMTPEEGFGIDSSKSSGRRSYCKDCDRRRARGYYEAHKDEFYARREAIREAEREAELKALEVEHRKRLAAARKLHEAQVRRQKEFMRSIGVPDLSPEEISERARRRPPPGVTASSQANRRPRLQNDLRAPRRETRQW
jgi:hypothetical protein